MYSLAASEMIADELRPAIRQALKRACALAAPSSTLSRQGIREMLAATAPQGVRDRARRSVDIARQLADETVSPTDRVIRESQQSECPSGST